jgi:hypothetical protein
MENERKVWILLIFILLKNFLNLYRGTENYLTKLRRAFLAFRICLKRDFDPGI